MKMEDFWEQFNILLNQWKNEKQKNYLDDTLLPKLNDILENMLSRDCDAVDFLHKTEFLSVCQTYFEQFVLLPAEVNVEILTFVIRCLGIALGSEEAFQYVEKHLHVLPLLSSLCSNSFISSDMSVQSSLLFCLNNIVKHVTGLNWILQIKNLTANVFETFNTPSFHVREDAINFLSNLFVKWYSEDLGNNMIKNLFDSLIENSIFPLIKNSDIDPKTKNCGISVLRIYLKQNKTLRFLLCEKYRLLEELIDYVKAMIKESVTVDDSMTIQTYPEPLILLIAHSFVYSQSGSAKAVDNFIDFLIQSPFIPSAMVLMTSLMTQKEEEEMPISPEQFSITLWPLLKYLKMHTVDDPRISERYQASLNSITDSKEQSVLLKTSLMCYKKILRHPDSTMSHQIIEVMADFFVTLDDDGHFADEWYGNKRLTEFMMELINLSAMIDPSELKYGEDLIKKLLAGLISIIKNSPDPHISSSCLITIRNYAEKSEQLFPLFEKLSGILVRQLYSRHSFIIEGCLEIIHHLVVKCTEAHEPWIKLLCSHQIFGTVWDIAGNVLADENVRAQAINVLHCFVNNRHMCYQLAEWNSFDEDKFTEFLLKIGKVEDDTITKAVLATFPYLLTICPPDSGHRFTMYSMLGKILQTSSDHDCQILALHTWQLISDAFIASASELSKKEAAQKTIRSLAVGGYCSSLLNVVNEENLIVRGEALQILLQLRKTLVDVGIVEQSFLYDKCDGMDCSHSQSQTFATRQYTLQEKNEGIDDVLNTSTLDQIKGILVLEDVPVLSVNGNDAIDEGQLTTLMQMFWKYLWSTQVEENLAFCNQSSDPYERNPISLLEDIIVARKEVCDVGEEYLNIDCY